MTQQSQPSEKLYYVRCQVPEDVHELARYVQQRCGMPNIPTAYTFLLCWKFYGQNFEDTVQELAADAGWSLPPLEPEPSNNKELEYDDDN